MSAQSNIGWTTHSFNTHWGCVEISPGCANCYAKAFAKRAGWHVWGNNKPRRFFGDKHWAEPRKWNAAAERSGEPTFVFTSSMADVFEDRRDLDPVRARLGELIDRTPALTWLVLTKRVDVMLDRWMWPAHAPPKNVVAMCTAEDQQRANERVPVLLQVPALAHGLSCEPLLSALDLRPWLGACRCGVAETEFGACGLCPARGVQWCIVGGESGSPRTRRTCDVAWIDDVVAQCVTAGVRVFVKQDSHFRPGQQGRITDATWARKDKAPALRILDEVVDDEPVAAPAATQGVLL